MFHGRRLDSVESSSCREETMSQTDHKAAKDMTEAMEETMQRLQGQFQIFSFTSTLDEMGTRIGDLEKNVSELMTQAGMEEHAASK